MFHQVPFISPTAVATTALIFLLTMLFASSLSSPGTAHADHGESRPTVSITALMPEFGEEGSGVTVTLKLSRPLTADEKYCYNAVSRSDPNFRKDQVCIEGGIKIEDSYHDHLYEGETTRPSDDATKFIFYGRQVEDRVNIFIEDDECITPNRQIKVWIDTAYQDRDEHPDETKYGYDIDTTVHTVHVIGNDDDDDPASLWPTFDPETHNSKSIMTCPSVETGATEGGDYNRAPTFDHIDSHTFHVDENTASGQDVGSPVSATDPESDTLTYSLQGQDAASFDIDSSSGQIETKAALDHETKSTYHVAVFVRDGRDIHGNSDTVDDSSIDVTINVTDVNERPEFDANAPASRNVVENTAARVDIGDPVTATDPENDTLTYSLDTDDGAAFEINSSGQIKTKEALDRETRASYTVTVSVHDGKDAEGNADTVIDDTHRLTITVDDENEPPSFADDAPTSVNVIENTPSNRNIGNPFTATDPERDTLTYSLGGTDAASFDIDTSSGQLKTKSELDIEVETSYSVTISVTDSKDDQGVTEQNPTPDDTHTVTINVTDENEPPQFADDAETTIEISEDTSTATDIGDAYTATDPENDTMTYSLSGPDASSFLVNTNGQLQLTEPLDYEDKSRLTVTIQVTDSEDRAGNTETNPVIDDTHTVAITVTNVFEAPEFDEEIPQGQSAIIRTVPENTAANQNIGAPVSATDDENDNLTYHLGGTDAASFNFDTSTGQIKTKDALNYESQSSYSVTVSVGDGKDGQNTVEDSPSMDTHIDVAIVVEDLNEKPVFDATPPIEYEIAENTAADTPIDAPLIATDEDEDETLTYGLTGTDAASFDIDTATGQIKTKADLNYEADSRKLYSVIVHRHRQQRRQRRRRAHRGNRRRHRLLPSPSRTTDDPGSITLSLDPPIAGTTLTATLEDQDGVKSDVAVTWKWEISS